MRRACRPHALPICPIGSSILTRTVHCPLPRPPWPTCGNGHSGLPADERGLIERAPSRGRPSSAAAIAVAQTQSLRG
jgi:hypothetical protein